MREKNREKKDLSKKKKKAYQFAWFFSFSMFCV